MARKQVHRCSCIGEEVDRFLAGLQKRRYSRQTLATYAYALESFDCFLIAQNIERLQDVRPDHLEQYQVHLLERKLSANTRELFLRTLRQFSVWLAEAGLVFSNPAAELALPRPTRSLQPIPTQAEVKRLLHQPDVSQPGGLRDRALLETGYSCGLRLAELQGLNLFDIDAGQSVVRIQGKGSKERIVPLTSSAIRWVQTYLRHGRPRLLGKDHGEDALWLARGGRRLGRERIQQIPAKHARAAGIRTPMSVHALRRACATHMLENGAHPVQLQLFLGHSSARTLSQYLQVSLRDMKKMHAKTKPGR